MSGSSQFCANHRLSLGGLALVMIGFVTPPPASAQQPPPEAEAPTAPSLHEQARNTQLPQARADFSAFRFIPPGDRVIERPDTKQLLFRRADGTPDGFAQQRGNAVFYYNRNGVLARVQRLGVPIEKKLVRKAKASR